MFTKHIMSCRSDVFPLWQPFVTSKVYISPTVWTGVVWRKFKQRSFTFPSIHWLVQCVPLATEPGWLADRCSLSQQLGALQTHNTDTFLFISHTTNVLLFKFRCNIFIGVRIIKKMPGSVVSGTPCICDGRLLCSLWRRGYTHKLVYMCVCVCVYNAD